MRKNVSTMERIKIACKNYKLNCFNDIKEEEDILKNSGLKKIKRWKMTKMKRKDEDNEDEKNDNEE